MIPTQQHRNGLRNVIERFAALRRRYVPESVAIIAAAAIAGILAGVGAWILKFSLGHMGNFFCSFLNPDKVNWYIGLLPVCAILIAGMYQRYITKSDLEQGSDHIARRFVSHRFNMPIALAYQPLIACIITLGLGGSAGAEGPIARSGAAIGSNTARLFGLQKSDVGMLLGCGAAAGIAGIFKAPVGGALFAIEVLKMPVRTISVAALMVASVCGAMTCYILTGFTFDVRFLPLSLFSPEKTWWIIALGFFCGLYSIYYSAIMHHLRRFFSGFKNPWVKNICGGIIVGVCVFLFPSMYGEGYSYVTALINGHSDSFLSNSPLNGIFSGTTFLIIAMAVVMLLKVFAAITSNSSGGVAGDFAPTIFAGAFAGAFFAMAANTIFDVDLPIALFALYGCAGAFSGIIHAPLMAMFLVSEMVGNGYGYFLPLMAVSVVSYITVKLFTPLSRYLNHDDIAALLHK